MTIAEALDSVLRRAVIRKDVALIEAYRDVYESRKNPLADTRDAFRLGMLISVEQTAHERTMRLNLPLLPEFKHGENHDG